MAQEKQSVSNLYGRSKRHALISRWPLIKSLTERTKRTEPKQISPITYLLLVPQDLHTSDPSLSIELDMKQFGLAGVTADISQQSAFDVIPPRQSWARDLHGFIWLRHLRAARSERATSQAVDIIAEWMYRYRRPTPLGPAFAPEVTARRLINWLSHSNFILSDTHPHFYADFMQSFEFQVRELERQVERTDHGMPRLIVLIALVLTGLCAANQELLIEKYAPKLSYALNQQILPDGGHISRKNSVLADLLLDLLPLKQCFVARDIAPPPAIMHTIRRIIPMIHYLRLGDGLMTRFNGVCATLPDTLSTAMSYDQLGTVELEMATHSHYYRLERGPLIAVMDGGKAPDLTNAHHAHAGCLSFELSVGDCPVIVNCGAAPPLFDTMQKISKATASHSTLTIDKRSSTRLVPVGDQDVVQGPLDAQVAITTHQSLPRLNGSHRGYVKDYNLVHRRSLWMERSGDKFQGRDEIEQDHMKRLTRSLKGASTIPYAIHFHLHPDVQAQRAKDGRSVILKLLNGDDWRFHASGKTIHLEASRFFADFAGPCQSLQMIIRGTTIGDTRIDWAMENISQHIETDKEAPVLETNDANNTANEKPKAPAAKKPLVEPAIEIDTPLVNKEVAGTMVLPDLIADLTAPAPSHTDKAAKDDQKNAKTPAKKKPNASKSPPPINAKDTELAEGKDAEPKKLAPKDDKSEKGA